MASTRAKAQLRSEALSRLISTVQNLTTLTGIEPVAIPTSHRDPELLMGYQLDAMATFIERMEQHLSPQATTLTVTDSNGQVTSDEFMFVPIRSVSRLVGLIETLTLDAGLEWETVDFTASATINPLDHLEQLLIKTLRAKGLIPETEGEVTIKYVDEDGNPVDEHGNPLDATPDDEDRDTEDPDPNATPESLVNVTSDTPAPADEPAPKTKKRK